KLPQRAKEMRWNDEPRELGGSDDTKAREVASVTKVNAPAGASSSTAGRSLEQVKQNADHDQQEAWVASVTAPPIPVDHGRLSLTVVDARTQQAVPGAWVSLLEAPDLEATSGPDGRARLDPMPGSLTLAVAKDGFEPTTQPVTAVVGQDRRITVQLQPVLADCTVKGKIVSEDGEPLRVLVKVSLIGSSSGPAEPQMFEGSYTMALTHGPWVVLALAPGYRGEPLKVDLLPGETRIKDLIMHRVAGDPVARVSATGAELSRRVAFVPGRAQLVPQAAATLNELAQALSGLSAALIVGVRVDALDLGASADDAVAALQLGEDRAKAIVDYLVSKGVPKQWLLPRGLGLAQPGQPTLELKKSQGVGDRSKSVF
ncbi:MAG: carboxypeptidase regulatory-like domain-containing protein, partial [Deltaproteobacteria bacterium]|nr:carboxypeptidase regulatory-like domain-containing protein [Deltaproteobacteria bacterium]